MNFCRKILVGFFLLLAAILAGLWIRSYRRVELFHVFNWKGGCAHLALSDGKIQFIWTSTPYPEMFRPPRWVSYRKETWAMLTEQLKQMAPVNATFAGISRGQSGKPAIEGLPFLSGPWWLEWQLAVSRLAIPIWMLMAIPALLLCRFAWLVWKLRQRGRNGFCINCGYDLRATPELCPECGAPRSQTKPKLRLRSPFVQAAISITTFCLLALCPHHSDFPAKANGIWREHASKPRYKGQRLLDSRYIVQFNSNGTFVTINEDDRVTPPDYYEQARDQRWSIDGDLLIVQPAGPATYINAWISNDQLIVYSLPGESPQMSAFLCFEYYASLPRETASAPNVINEDAAFEAWTLDGWAVKGLDTPIFHTSMLISPDASGTFHGEHVIIDPGPNAQSLIAPGPADKPPVKIPQ